MSTPLGSYLPRFIWASIILFTLFLGIVAWKNPPAVYPDPGWGFQVIRSMEQGGNFNRIVAPSHSNIAENESRFLTWWSPGQYLVPYFFKSTLHVNYGQASVLTTIVCELLGLAGLYAFFKKVGFSAFVSALSIAVVAGQQFYFIPYVFYNGGELTLFAFAGWFLYGCFSFTVVDWKAMLFVLLSGWVGFICKSAFIWIYLAGLSTLWIYISHKHKAVQIWLGNAIRIAIPAVVSLACIYIFFLSKGENPVSEHRAYKFIWETFGFPLGSPLLSGFSIDDLTGGLVSHSDDFLFSYSQSVLILLLCTAITMGLIWALLRSATVAASYKIVLTVFYIIAVVFFGYVFLRQLDISYEGRHFRVLGLIFIPGVVYLITKARLPYKLGAAGLWIALIILSVAYLVKGKKITWYESAHGSAGISQQYIDPYSLKRIIQLDDQYRGGIFVFTSADLSLEINHNRTIILQHLGAGDQLDNEEYTYKGHAGPLFILFPPDDAEHDNEALLRRCFPQYQNFRHEKLSDEYVLYSAD